MKRLAFKDILYKRKINFSNVSNPTEDDVCVSRHQCFTFSKSPMKRDQLNEIVDCNDVRTGLKMFKTGCGLEKGPPMIVLQN